MIPMLITIGMTVLALVVGYFVLRRLRAYGYLVCALVMIGIVFLASAALLYLLPLVGYTPQLPTWSMQAVWIGLLTMVLLTAIALLVRWQRHKLPLEKKENLAAHDDTEFLERL